MNITITNLNVVSGLVVASIGLFASQVLAIDIDPTSDVNVKPVVLGKLKHQYQLFWSDEFNGNAIDENKWEYRQDSKHWSTQMARNIEVKNGVVHLVLKKEKVGDKEYTGAGIISRSYFRYGYYEARVKVPASAGWHTSFWMMDNNHIHSDTSQLELDPLENDSINPHQYTTDYHQWRGKDGHFKRYQRVKTPIDEPLNEFQIFGMEWTPEGAYFYRNGKFVNEATYLNKEMPKKDWQAGKKPERLLVTDLAQNDVQIWFTSIATWLGNTEKVDDSALPASAQADYIRFFKQID